MSEVSSKCRRSTLTFKEHLPSLLSLLGNFLILRYNPDKPRQHFIPSDVEKIEKFVDFINLNSQDIIFATISVFNAKKFHIIVCVYFEDEITLENIPLCISTQRIRT